jgi:aquaporin Z
LYGENYLNLAQQMLAEFLGTFFYLFAGCGATLLAVAYPHWHAGAVEVALTFGVSYFLISLYARDRSGCHLNPAVSLGLRCAGRFPQASIVPYTAAQVTASVLASFALSFAASGPVSLSLAQGATASRFAMQAPLDAHLFSTLAAELFLSFTFVIVFLAANEPDVPPIATSITISGAVIILYIIGLPFTNLSINPARSTGPAILLGGWAARQLWLFWVAPLLGAALAGWVYRYFFPPEPLLDNFDC